jgi:hypothetical protein
MVQLASVKELTDDFGIWQHARDAAPERDEGYALDDATRAIILYLLTDTNDQASTLLNYLAASYKDDQWRGFASANRYFLNATASEDAIGQVVWAAALAEKRGFEPAMAKHIYQQAKTALGKAHYLRGSAYALLGATYVDAAWAHELAADITRRFAATTPEWPWPEQLLNYANGIIPLSLLRYGRLNQDKAAIDLGHKTLDFIDHVCHLNQAFGPIGNKGWFEAGMAHPAQFGQQPIDAAYMVWAYVAAYEQSNNKAYLKKAEEWLSWFHGNNVAQATIGDPHTGLCLDGIDGPKKVRPSRNSGAESRVCYGLALWAIERRQSF